MIKIFDPSKELATIVKHYVVIESVSMMHKMLFLPNGGNFIVFNRSIQGYSQAFKCDTKAYFPSEIFVSRKSTKVKQMFLDETDDRKYTLPVILIELLPLGYYHLFKKDASLINAPFEQIEESLRRRYFDKVYTHESIEDEIKELNSSLLELFRSHEHKPCLIEEIVNKITFEEAFETRIEELLKEFPYSRSTFERQFKKVIGMAPKKFMFIMKFCKTLKSFFVNGKDFRNLPYVYSDQSHMHSVFKKFLGLNPTEVVDQINNNSLNIYQITTRDIPL